MGYNNIVFYDGHCLLCSKSVDALIAIDRRKVLRFAPLQGQTAKQLSLSFESLPPKEQSIYYMRKSPEVFDRSDAIIELLQDLFSWGRIFRVLKLLPKCFRDALYSLVARYRYNFFGRSEVCKVPSDTHKERFLD